MQKTVALSLGLRFTPTDLIRILNNYSISLRNFARASFKSTRNFLEVPQIDLAPFSKRYRTQITHNLFRRYPKPHKLKPLTLVRFASPSLRECITQLLNNLFRRYPKPHKLNTLYCPLGYRTQLYSIFRFENF